MRSWNRVIKASSASSDTNKAMITTKYEQTKKVVETDEIDENESVSGEQTQATMAKAEQLLKEAELESKQLIEESQAEISQIKKEAQESGHQAGYEAGFQEGYQTGYSEGFEKAIAENQEIRERAVQMLHESHEAMQTYESARKQEFLKLATHMAEKIIHDYIDQSDDGLLAIAKPFFYQLDKEEEFVTIAVHPKKRAIIEEKLDEIKSISPGTRFMILGDPSLAERGILIESSHAVVDLQIRNQLDRMLEEFDEMERTVDA